MTDIVRVAAKVRAFREEHPPSEMALLTDFSEDEVDGVARVVGHARVVLVDTGAVVAEAFGTRALRAPVPGAQGHKDTRDPDRAMTQAVGRVLGLLGYASGDSLEGDTDEADESGVSHAARGRSQPQDDPRTARLKELNGLLTPEQKTDYKAWLKEKGYGDQRTPEQIEDCITYLETLTKAAAA